MIRLAAFILAVASAAGATTVTEDFTSLEHRASSSTAVWNLAENRAHLPYFADAKGQGANSSIDIGTGKDGAFESSTYSNFDPSASSTLVTLDTSRVYEFTTFNLGAGVTLKGSGSAPLRIRVQGDASILGTIDLRGQAGSNLDGDTSQAPAGGAAGPGGGTGGNGGSTASGTAGTSADSGNLGSGKGGSNNLGTGAGGGGAGHDTGGAAGAGVGAGAAGGNYGDIMLSTLLGGSGGGGGGASSNSSGAGAGGGGGALSLEVGGDLHIFAAGQGRADGGAGGGPANGALQGGGGGGGSGGGLLFLSGGIFQNDGSILALGGSGGAVTLGGAGGNGQAGRTRIVNSVDNFYAGNVENPVPNMADFGRVVFDTSATFLIESTSYDTQNSAPTYTSAVTTGTVPGSTTAALEIAGSSDNFVLDTTGFVPAATPSLLDGKRYFKFRLSLTSVAAGSSPDIRSVVVDFTPKEQGKFSFGFAGCARVSPPGSAGSPFGALALLAYLVTLPIWGKRRRARR